MRSFPILKIKYMVFFTRGLGRDIIGWIFSFWKKKACLFISYIWQQKQSINSIYDFKTIINYSMWLYVQKFWCDVVTADRNTTTLCKMGHRIHRICSRICFYFLFWWHITILINLKLTQQQLYIFLTFIPQSQGITLMGMGLGENDD